MGWLTLPRFHECAWCHTAFEASRSSVKYCSDEHRAKAWRFAQRARRANIAAHALAALAVNQLYLVLMQQDPTTVAALTQDAHLVAKGRSPGQLEIPVP